MGRSRRDAHLQALNNSPRAGYLHCPSGLKAAARRANDITQEVQAENELLMTEAELRYSYTQLDRLSGPQGSGQHIAPPASPQKSEGSVGLFDKFKHAFSHDKKPRSPAQKQPAAQQLDKASAEALKRTSMQDPGHQSVLATAQPNSQQTQQVRDLQHKVSLMEAQLQEVEQLKLRLLAEQRAATDWKERWNYQNFKLNLVVDMMVLRLVEAEAAAYLLLNLAWCQRQDLLMRGLMWCLHTSSHTHHAASQPHRHNPRAWASAPPPAKRTKTEQAAEPSQPTKGTGKGKPAHGKAASQPGRWVDRDCNAALNMQCIGESKWCPLELCWWLEQLELPYKGREYPGLGYTWRQDGEAKAHAQQPVAQWLDRDTNGCLNLQRTGESMQRPLELCSYEGLEALPTVGTEYQQGYKRVIDRLPKARWSTAIKPQLQQLAAATQAGTTLDSLQAHILALKATWDALWEEYLKPRWCRERLRLHHAQERVIEGFEVVEGMMWVSRQHYSRERGVAVFLGAGCFSQGGWKARAVREGFRKVVQRPSRLITDDRPDRLVSVDEFRTSRVSSHS
ncbi:hypothetical protein QJQ45_001112 [Haematococcus lacustris]|nr:hypothetical protein QJQ45_001112 [Haematococcus lacustris]